MIDLISRQAALKAVDWDSEAFSAILNLPTIDPVKHGEWVKKYDVKYGEDIYCSVCGEMALSPSYWECGLEQSNYCPNCGAKMDITKGGNNVSEEQ